MNLVCFLLGHVVEGRLDTENELENYVECLRCKKRAQSLRSSALWQRRQTVSLESFVATVGDVPQSAAIHISGLWS